MQYIPEHFAHVRLGLISGVVLALHMLVAFWLLAASGPRERIPEAVLVWTFANELPTMDATVASETQARAEPSYAVVVQPSEPSRASVKEQSTDAHSEAVAATLPPVPSPGLLAPTFAPRPDGPPVAFVPAAPAQMSLPSGRLCDPDVRSIFDEAGMQHCRKE